MQGKLKPKSGTKSKTALQQRDESSHAIGKAFGQATKFMEETKTTKRSDGKGHDTSKSKKDKEKEKQKRKKSRQPSQKKSKKKGHDSSGDITDEEMPGEGSAYRPMSRNASDFNMAKKSLGAFSCSTSRMESPTTAMLSTTWSSASVLMPSGPTLMTDRSPTGSQKSSRAKLTREASRDQEEDKLKQHSRKSILGSMISKVAAAPSLKGSVSAWGSMPGADREEEMRKKLNDYVFQESKDLSALFKEPSLSKRPSVQGVGLNVVTRFSYSTKTGVVPHNPNKTNQDQYVVSPKLLSKKFLHLFGICDGHGQMGREASAKTKERLIENIQAELRIIGVSEKGPEALTDTVAVKKALHRAYVQTHADVSKAPFDTNFRWVRALSLLVGPPAAIFYSLDVEATVRMQEIQERCLEDRRSQVEVGQEYQLLEFTALALSRDHKPDEKDQEARVVKYGGRVRQYKDPHSKELLGPLRVWAKAEEYPGLAMTRSIGDDVAKRLGVIPEPQIKEHEFTCSDKFIIIASDGVWEFMENEEAVNIVAPFYPKKDAEGAANAIARDAVKRWQSREDVVDDITCVILFLGVPDT